MKRKNIIINLFGLLSILAFSGCDDFLHVTSDTQKQASESFKTIADLRSATAFLYTQPWFEFNSNSYQVLESRANNIDADGTSSTFLTYAMFAETSGTAGLIGMWNSLYNVITHSDYVIDQYASTAQSNGLDETAVDACVAEARFMRATAYWYLAMTWHDVPIIDNPEQFILNPLIHSNRFEDVIQYAIYDLEYAAQKLPDTDSKGRVTKFSAEGMLARVCLTAANYAMGNHFSGNYLSRNEVGSNSELATKYFAKVKELTYNVIETSQYDLMEDYEDLFKVQNNNNKETLFGLQFIPGNTSYGFGNSRQDNLGAHADLTGGLNAWGGSIYGSYDLVHLYDLDGGLSRTRGNVFVASYNYSYLGTHTDAGSWTVEKEKSNIKKFIVGSSKDTEGVAINGNTGLVTPIIRLAELYLMYTEASMGTADETTDAIAVGYYNDVRERAFFMNKSDFTPVSKVTRNDMFKERRMEFFMELLFWPDIVRRSFYDTDWVERYLNNELMLEDEYTELTNYIWWAYTYNPSAYPNGSGWDRSPRTAGVVPITAVHDMGSATYVHSPDANDNIWALPYPETEASKNPLLNEEPVPYNF